MKASERAENNIDAKVIIAAVLEALEMNAPAFAKATGISYQRVYDLQRGRTKKFNPGVVNMITAAFPQIRKEYLYTGDGAVLSDDVPADLIPNPLDRNAHAAMEKVLEKQEELMRLSERLAAKERELHEKEIALLQREYEVKLREARARSGVSFDEEKRKSVG